MDVKELFSKESETVVSVKFRGASTLHYLRQPTADEDLEYRRRSSKINFKSRRVETTDAALQAPLWLYDRLITKVCAHNGNSNELQEVPIEMLKDQSQLKLAVINKFLSDIEIEEEGELKN